MHTVDLSMEHAMGQAKCTKLKEIVDQFKACNELRLKLKNCLSWLMSRRAKKRFKEYTAVNKNFAEVLALELPNETRVGGTQRMFESVLWSYHALQNYSKENAHFSGLFPGKNDWNQIAEYHAVLKEVYKLSMNVQTKKAAYISVAFFECIICQIRLFKKEVYIVVNTDVEARWQLKQAYVELPMVKRKVSESKKVLKEN